MRTNIISFLKSHPIWVNIFWKIMWIVLNIVGFFIPIQKKKIIFCSFGGRRFDDSPKAVYDTICSRVEFKDWKLVWAFNNPEEFDIPRGEKVKIDTVRFFITLLQSRVWVSNSGMDRGIGLQRKKNVIVETWHGTPLKKILGDENQNTIGGKNKAIKRNKDYKTIRCAQSEYDKALFCRLFNADASTVLMCDLPRNDELCFHSENLSWFVKNKLRIPSAKKVILYAPTYREYLVDENRKIFLAPPIDMKKWKRELGEEYVLLVRAHYAVVKELNIVDDEFVHDVSNYPSLNELYIISDIMISDYSSTYFDYSILNRPMVCFAYDLDEYIEKRGLYLDLCETLPCPICRNEDEVINDILKMDYIERSCLTMEFHKKFAPYAGNASDTIVEEIINRL